MWLHSLLYLPIYFKSMGLEEMSPNMSTGRLMMNRLQNIPLYF